MTPISGDGIFAVSSDAGFLATIEGWGPLSGAPVFTFPNLQEAYGQLEAYDPLLLLVDRRTEAAREG